MARESARLAENHEVPPQSETGPHKLCVATIACNIVNRREELLVDDAVVVLAAEGYLAFATITAGRTPAVLKDRSPEYARQQRSAKKGLAYEDMCGMALTGGAEGAEAVRALWAPIAAALEERGSGIELCQAAADLAREAQDIPNAMLLGKTEAEIDREMLQLEEAVRIYKRAKQRRREVSAPFAAVTGGHVSGGRQ